MKKFILFLLPFFLLACKAKSVDSVEAFMFKQVPAERTDNNTQPLLANLSGTYLTSEGVEFSIAGNGRFDLDGITYSLHQAISERHGIFKAETPIENSSRKMVTFHGVAVNDEAVYSAGLKDNLDFSETPRFTPEETPYAAALNGGRIENIDFDPNKATRFGVRI